MQKHNEHRDNMNIPPQTMLILICDIKQLDILYQKKKLETVLNYFRTKILRLSN